MAVVSTVPSSSDQVLKDLTVSDMKPAIMTIGSSSSDQVVEVTATPEEAKAIWQEEARTALNAWAETYLHDSPLSRDTQKHNEVYLALAVIRGVLDQL